MLCAGFSSFCSKDVTFWIVVLIVVVSFEMEIFALTTVSFMVMVTSGVMVSFVISGGVCGCIGVVVVLSWVGGGAIAS